jgi:hypothetical protein
MSVQHNKFISTGARPNSTNPTIYSKDDRPHTFSHSGRRSKPLASNDVLPDEIKFGPSPYDDEEEKYLDPMVGGASRFSVPLSVDSNLSESLQTLLDLCEFYGFRRKTFNSHKTLQHWQICSMQCNWIKFLKYKFSAFMSFYLDQEEMPEKPFTQPDAPNQLAGGALGRFIRLTVKGPNSWDFRVSLLMIKKGLPKPDESFLDKAIIDTKNILTQPHPVIQSRYSSYRRVLYEAERTVREVFTRRITDADLRKPYVPSIRANYTDSRSRFGTFGTLMDMGVIVDSGLPVDIYSRALVRDVEERKSDGLRFVLNPEFKTGIDHIYGAIYDAVRVLAVDEVADVKLVAIPEALKVRVISKGPALTYFILKPVQKYLHKILRKFRPFRLIGKTVSIDDLFDCFAKEKGSFHSLDYRSATDLLDPAMSKVIVDAICDSVEMPGDIRSLFHKALTGHSIEGVPQLWGQLMGSIVSFIVLCVANFSVVRHSLEIVNGVKYSVNDCPVLINGDDGLVRAPDSFLSVWKEIAASIGLQPSVGKTYTHPEYCNINSTSFLFKEIPAHGHFGGSSRFEQIPYVNMGLVNGNTRAGSKDLTQVFDPEDNDWSMGVRHHQLMSTCPPEVRLSVHELFLKKNSLILKSLHSIPWYIPESLGGVGLQPLVQYAHLVEGEPEISTRSYLRTSSGHICGPSRSDVMCAWSLQDKVHRGLVVGRIPSLQPIQARPVWSSVIYNNIGSRTVVDLTENEETFLDLSTFFAVPSSVATRLSTANRLESLRRNERVWQSLSRALGTLSHQNDEDLFL